MAEQGPVEKLVFAIFLSSIKKRATRIRMSSTDTSMRVYFEIDCTLVEEMRPPIKLRDAMFDQLESMQSEEGFICIVIGGERRYLFSIMFVDDGAVQAVELRAINATGAA